MTSSAAGKPRSFKWLVWLAGVTLLLVFCVGPVSWGLWRWRTSPGFTQHSRWEIGRLKLNSTEPQELPFVYQPGVNELDGIVSLEFRGWPLDNHDRDPPALEFTMSVRDAENTVCDLKMETGTGWCNWHKPNAGRVVFHEFPRGALVPGGRYVIEIIMAEPVEVPEDVEVVLHGSWLWRGTPDHLYP